MIVDNKGNVTSEIADALTTKLPQPDEWARRNAAQEREQDREPTTSQPKRRPYKPSPGKVLVKRHEAARFFERGDLKLERHSAYVQRDDAFEIYATVVAIGPASQISGEAWFSLGQDCTVEPSLLRDIHLTPDYVVWSGPYSAITGVFDDEEEM